MQWSSDEAFCADSICLDINYMRDGVFFPNDLFTFSIRLRSFCEIDSKDLSEQSLLAASAETNAKEVCTRGISSLLWQCACYG